jgi:hypothetical protein
VEELLRQNLRAGSIIAKEEQPVTSGVIAGGSHVTVCAKPRSVSRHPSWVWELRCDVNELARRDRRDRVCGRRGSSDGDGQKECEELHLHEWYKE